MAIVIFSLPLEKVKRHIFLHDKILTKRMNLSLNPYNMNILCNIRVSRVILSIMGFIHPLHILFTNNDIQHGGVCHKMSLLPYAFIH